MDHESLFLEMLQRIEARQESGFNGLNARLDALNGRTRKNSEAIAVLEDRTGNMTCAEHAERFKAIEQTVGRIESQGPLVPGEGRQVNWRNGKVVAVGAVGGFATIYAAIDLGKTIVTTFWGK